MVINYAEKTNNYNAAIKFIVVGANVQRWKEQKQVDKCKLHLKVFQWPEAWTFIRSRKGNC
jgi:hypothetical protein